MTSKFIAVYVCMFSFVHKHTLTCTDMLNTISKYKQEIKTIMKTNRILIII